MTKLLLSVVQGKLLGSTKCNVDGGQFYSFQGIPYAKPPLGNLRFKAPIPPEQWTGVRDARTEGDECYAKYLNTYMGSENCLFLNVFTKEISSKTKRPVMVWIHGGGFTTGSSKENVYSPEYLMTEDIVLVTINYRLGPLGFLCLEDTSLGVSGNAGLKDMVMALKWIQQNISTFSGDPGNVTIFGESAGGAAVHYLMLSPMAKGLFHKAIAQSGCAFNSWAQAKRYTAHLLAESLGIESKDEKIMLEQLQHVPVEELLHGSESVKDKPFFVGCLRPFGPIIEKPSRESFISDHPLKIIKSGKYNHVPLLTGCVSKEGMFIYAICSMHKAKNMLVPETLVPHNMNLRKGSEMYNIIVNKIMEYYFKGQDPLKNRDNIYTLYTDNFFLYDAYNMARHHLNTTKCPIYFYRFNLDTNLNTVKQLYNITGEGTCHGDDFAYLFKNDFCSVNFDSNSSETIGIRRMVKMWTNFAKLGNPTPFKNDPLLPIEWKPITKEKFNILEIGKKLELLKEHPQKQSIEFWDELYQFRSLTSKI